jgi:hypothetical protein
MTAATSATDCAMLLPLLLGASSVLLVLLGAA